MPTYSRILTRLINVPMLLEQSKFELITSNISLKLIAGQSLESGIASPTEKQIPKSKDIFTIRVFDSLVSKNAVGESGLTSYEAIYSQINYAIEEGYKKIGFYIDSGGGEAFGNFPLCEYIASLPAKGIETFAKRH